jgi:hypothetical protein
MRASRPGSTSERAYLGQYGGIYLLQRFLYDTEGDAYRVRLVDVHDRLGIPELEIAAQQSASDILTGLAQAMWNGLGGGTPFDTMRTLAAQENPRGFLHVRNAKSGGSATLLPASISFWSSANGIPHVFSTDPTARFVVVPLAGEYPRGLDLPPTRPGTARSASSPAP